MKDLQNPTAYYAGFQPTSFEQALGNQYFQNVEPSAEESIKHGLSLSGLDSSPILASMLGKQMGQTQFDIGSYLSAQAGNRADQSLTNRLNIDPQSVLQGYLSTDTNQSNTNTQQQNDYQQQLAQVAYQQQVDKYNQQNALYKMIGSISPIGGAIYGGISGGGGGLTQSLGGSMDMLKTLMPMMTAMGGGISAPVNPATGASVNSANPFASAMSPANYGMSSSQYNPSNYFSGFTGRGSAV